MNTNDFGKFDRRDFMRFTNPALIEKDLQTLVGIIQGIRSDSIINEREHTAVLNWMGGLREYEEKQPYKEILAIVRQALADNIMTYEECDGIIYFCNQYIKRTGYYSVITAGIQKLTGIVKGIAMDEEINIVELEYLDEWLEDNEFLKNSWPYDEIYNLVTSILQDHVITKEEHISLLNFCKALVGEDLEAAANDVIKSLKTGFYQIDPNIVIQEKTFCITGVSKKYQRREIAAQIELYGGYMVDTVSQKLNYLVVCDEKNTCWAFTCYGKKIEQAIKHRKQGRDLVIVHEFDLYDTLAGL